MIRLTKIEEPENALHKNNIAVGYVRDGDMPFGPPKLGERFYVDDYWSTSAVQEIINDSTFRTYNSIYHWETLELK